MDKGTVIGFVIGFGCVLAAITFHGNLTDFVDVPGMLVCLGGTLAAALVAFPLKSITGLPATLSHVWRVKVPEPRAEIARLAEYAGVVRREGLLALEARLAGVADPFLKRGLELVVENAPREKVEESLAIEIDCLRERHTTGKKVFEQMGAMAPAFGMVGTLIGLIQMLGSLDDPSRIGAGMAVAMITTFYGALLANMVFLPIAAKLDQRSREEAQVRTLMLHGLLGLVDQDSPRVLAEKLKAFLAPEARREPDADAAQAA